MIREFNNPELAPRNSFHVAQRAARLIEFDRTEDLQELFEKGMPDPWYVLGGGNNVLFTQDYPGTLLTPVAQGIRIVDEQPDCVTVEADAGVETTWSNGPYSTNCGDWKTSRSSPAKSGPLRFRISGLTAARPRMRSEASRCSARRPSTRSS